MGKNYELLYLTSSYLVLQNDEILYHVTCVHVLFNRMTKENYFFQDEI